MIERRVSNTPVERHPQAGSTSTGEKFDCPECSGKDTVWILPTAGGRGTGEPTCYGAKCAACDRMLVDELPSNCDGKKSTATREFKRLLSLWSTESGAKRSAPRDTPAAPAAPEIEEDWSVVGGAINLGGRTFNERDLLERALGNLRSFAPRHGEVRWVLVGQLFGTGSTVSAAMCRQFGYDPDERVRP